MSIKLIVDRRNELDQEIEELTNSIAAKRAELDELNVAESVFRRLSGSNDETASPAKPVARGIVKSSKPPATQSGNLSVRQMILEALMDAQQRGLDGLAPKDIRSYIEKTHGKNVGPQANTVSSRMWRDMNVIDKNVETGLFSLPQKDEGTDELPYPDASAPSLFQPLAKDREAGSGGGP